MSMLSVPFLIWFASCLRSALEHERYGRIAFGGAIGGSVIVAAEVMMLHVGALRTQSQGNIAPEIASALFDLSTAIGGAALPVSLSAMFIAIGLASLRNQVIMSRVLAIVTIVIGILSALVVFPVGTLLFPSLIWLAVISCLMLRRAT